MHLSLATARSAATAAALFVTIAAVVPATAQEGSSAGQQGQSAGAESGSSAGSDGGEPSFLEGILPDFVKGWFGMDEGSGSSADASAAGGQGGGGQGAGGGGDRQPAVVVARAGIQSVGERYEFIGRIEAIQEVALQARVAGFIQDVLFDGGDRIKAGDKLFQIEPAEYEANLLAAQAQLASARAQESQAQRSLQRNQELAQNGTVAQAQLDDARATFESSQGTRLQAEAQVRQAQLALDYTSIDAPIDGEISEPLITKGNYVTVSSGALANLTQMNPIWGSFPIGENRLATWRRVGMDEERSQNDAQVRNYRLSLILPNDQEYAPEGDFSFVSNTVDPQTGTVEVRVSFPNPEAILLPNQNVTLVASEKSPPRLPVVPQAAIQLDREGRSVFVLGEDDTVRRVPVTVGKQLRGEVAIAKGLEGGEYVVVQGLQNIADGAKVKPTFQDGGEGPGAPNAQGEEQRNPQEGGAPSGQAEGGQASGGEASGGSATGEEESTAATGDAADQRIGSQSASETRAAEEAGPANKQTPVGPQSQSEPREKSENLGEGSENGS